MTDIPACGSEQCKIDDVRKKANEACNKGAIANTKATIGLWIYGLTIGFVIIVAFATLNEQKAHAQKPAHDVAMTRIEAVEDSVIRQGEALNNMAVSQHDMALEQRALSSAVESMAAGWDEHNKLMQQLIDKIE